MKYKNISIKGNDDYIVLRMVFKKKPYNKCYIVRQWGSFKTALTSALNHRDSMRAVFKNAKENGLELRDW